MKTFLLILGILLLPVLLWANPFVGMWSVEDDHYQVTETNISGIMDGHAYESGYTFTDLVWAWKDRAWAYRFIDKDHILLAGIDPNSGRPWYWLLVRIIDLPKAGA